MPVHLWKLLLVGFLFVGIVLSYFWLFKSQHAYETFTAIRTNIATTAQYSGHVDAASQTQVYSPTAGVVTDILVQNGDIVISEQELISIHAVSTEAEQQAAYAAYLAATTKLNTAIESQLTLKADLELARKSILDAVLAKRDFDDSRTAGYSYIQEEIDTVDSNLLVKRDNFQTTEKQYLNVDTAITDARTSVSAAWAAYQATRDSIVTAPMTGTVVNIEVRAGDNTKSKSQADQGTILLTIADFSEFTLAIEVHEDDISHLSDGQSGTIVLDAFPNKQFDTSIRSIDTIGAIDQGLVTYEVLLAITAPSTIIKPGMSATATIETHRADNVLTVPTAALQTKDGQTYVRVLTDSNALDERQITTGLFTPAYVEVTSGISEGEKIVIPSIPS